MIKAITFFITCIISAGFAFSFSLTNEPVLGLVSLVTMMISALMTLMFISE